MVLSWLLFCAEPARALQVMGEDLVLVSGQQDRMLRGADVWGNPVAYDKLGVRYRRWRNSVTAGRHDERREIENELRPMSAGELFRCAPCSALLNVVWVSVWRVLV